MNALNILSGKSTPTYSQSRTASTTDLQDSLKGVSEATQEKSTTPQSHDDDSDKSSDRASDDAHARTERTPLMQDQQTGGFTAGPSTRSWRLVPKRIADAFVTSVKVVLSTIAAPVLYVVACFYDDQGYFSAILPIRRVYRVSSRKKRRKSAQIVDESALETVEDDRESEKPRLRPKDSDDGIVLSASGRDVNKREESAVSHAVETDDGPAQNTRSKSAQPEEIAPAKRSIRIKLHSDAAEKRRHRSHKSIDTSATAEDDRVNAVANSLKSPSSPTFAPKLKYPRLPAPPRPLVPRRQPSYITAFHNEPPRKTLVIDLDETLIHSMAKSNRMSTGHMVEVKFQGPVGGSGLVLGPQVPILYFVHERPHCHEFLRKVCDSLRLHEARLTVDRCQNGTTSSCSLHLFKNTPIR